MHEHANVSAIHGLDQPDRAQLAEFNLFELRLFTDPNLCLINLSQYHVMAQRSRFSILQDKKPGESVQSADH